MCMEGREGVKSDYFLNKTEIWTEFKVKFINFLKDHFQDRLLINSF